MPPSEWKVPGVLQPKPGDCDFDLDLALASVLHISSTVPETAFSAATLGTERAGNAVLIREDGLAVTIGYLVNEADSIWLRSGDGKVLPAHVMGIDQSTGFALVQTLGHFDIAPMPIGDSDTAQLGERVVVAGGGGRQRSVAAKVVARQPFAGYWEYLVNDAIFTAPSHPNWGGTAVIGAQGELLGIGSLQLEQSRGRGITENINMSVPINLLKPVMEDIITLGQPNRPPRPWLGVYATEVEDRVVLMGVTDRGPAKKADLRVGDVILAVEGTPVVTLSSFYKKLWRLGDAGVEVRLTIVRDGQKMDVRIVTGDRNRVANSPRLH
jgi:S1-C subfamily serine protease